MCAALWMGCILAVQTCRADSEPGASAPPDVTSVCDILRNPQQFNGKWIRVRGRVIVEFEDFELALPDCGPAPLTGIWLEYGRGPKFQPTTWCCGDMVPRDPLEVTDDADFRKFHRDLTARRRGQACSGRACYRYDVTATLAGRFDTILVDARGRCSGGFGHFGATCARLVIQSVRDVSSVPAEQAR